KELQVRTDTLSKKDLANLQFSYSDSSASSSDLSSSASALAGRAGRPDKPDKPDKPENTDKLRDIRNYMKKPKIEVSSVVRLGLIYYDEIGARIPRQEVADTYEIINEILFKKDPRIISECCGSYRRGKETSGDIDILISHPHIINETDLILHGGSLLCYLLNELQKIGKLEITLNAGMGRFQGLIRTANNHVRRCDIFWVPYDSYYACLLYLTGSDIFNRLTRCIAHRKGYTMSNWGLYPFDFPEDQNIRRIKRNKLEEPDINWKTMNKDSHAPSKYLTGSKILLRSEQEIFEILGIEWLPPNQRI
ncbi:MAG: hypothetical protein WD512_09180, partial [Candidatus Paceibacterota bacterium]